MILEGVRRNVLPLQVSLVVVAEDLQGRRIGEQVTPIPVDAADALAHRIEQQLEAVLAGLRLPVGPAPVLLGKVQAPQQQALKSRKSVVAPTTPTALRCQWAR